MKSNVTAKDFLLNKNKPPLKKFNLVSKIKAIKNNNVISNISTSTVTATQAVITWNTNEGTKGTVAYGLNDSYGISTTSVYRALKDFLKPRTVHRVDHGKPRVLPKLELERYCELVAALKLRSISLA